MTTQFDLLKRLVYMRNIPLSIFVFCLFFCATFFLVIIWTGREPAEESFRPVLTSFIVGLASFLVWFVSTLKTISDRV